VIDAPDTEEGKLAEVTAADEWDITSPTVEQRPSDASSTLTPPEKKKKPRFRGMGNRHLSSSCTMRCPNMHTFADRLVFICSSMCT